MIGLIELTKIKCIRNHLCMGMFKLIAAWCIEADLQLLVSKPHILNLQEIGHSKPDSTLNKSFTKCDLFYVTHVRFATAEHNISSATGSRGEPDCTRLAPPSQGGRWEGEGGRSGRGGT